MTRSFSCRLKNCEVVSSPQDVNEAIQDAVAFLQVPRPDLGILCSSRGAYAGEHTDIMLLLHLLSTILRERKYACPLSVCSTSLPSAPSSMPARCLTPIGIPTAHLGPTALILFQLCRQAACARSSRAFMDRWQQSYLCGPGHSWGLYSHLELQD